MRKINAFLSMMPKDLIEFQADIVSDYDGRHHTGDTLKACPFGRNGTPSEDEYKTANCKCLKYKAKVAK